MPAPRSPIKPAAPFNILVMLLDDTGVELLRAYDDINQYESPFPYAATPNLDALAKGGLRFRQCRVSPRCSPTRAQVQTGRYAFRTGVGDVINQVPEPNFALQPGETILPELLAPAGYQCAAIGKWHLGNTSVSGQPQDPDSWKITPNVAGYPHYAGCLFNLNSQPSVAGRPDYFRWMRVEDGVAVVETRYATTRQAEDAIRWLKHAKEPWFLYLAWNAIHGPFNWPPSSLHSYGPVPPDQETAGAEPRALNTRARAMLEALDTEIGRVLKSIRPPAMSRTMLLVIGDNGADGVVMRIHPTDISGPQDPTTPSIAPYDSEKFKNSVYEGGIRVPFLVRGPLVSQPGRAVDHFVDGVDLFSTVLSIAARAPSITLPAPPPVDGVDLLPLIENPAAGPVRAFSLAEIFRPNGLPVTGPFADRRREVQRSYIDPAGFKLIQRRNVPVGTPGHGANDEVYNVFDDPLEVSPLDPEDFPGLYEGLDAVLAS